MKYKELSELQKTEFINTFYNHAPLDETEDLKTDCPWSCPWYWIPDTILLSQNISEAAILFYKEYAKQIDQEIENDQIFEIDKYKE
jgi:hypothetical protein